MNCTSPQDPEPMMTESLITLLSRGALLRARDQPDQATQLPSPAPRQESFEARSLRIRRVLQAAVKITSERLYEDDEEFEARLQVSRAGLDKFTKTVQGGKLSATGSANAKIAALAKSTVKNSLLWLCRSG